MKTGEIYKQTDERYTMTTTRWAFIYSFGLDT